MVTGIKRTAGGPIALPLLPALLLFLLLGACDSDTNGRTSGPVPTGTVASKSTVTAHSDIPSQPARTEAPARPTLPSSAISTVSSPTVQSSPTDTITSPISASVDITTAWGAKLAVKRTPVAVGQDYVFFPNAAIPGGKLLFGSVGPRQFTEAGGPEPGYAAFMDIETQKITKVRRFPHNDTQMGAASADENWVVWIEASQEPAFFSDWALYAYNLNSHSIKQIAKAPRDARGQVIPGSIVLPDIDHGMVVWGESSPVQGDNTHAFVKSADLQTGQVRTLTDLGLNPRISWPHVMWMGPKLEPGKQLEDIKQAALVILDLQSADMKTLVGPDTPRGYDIYGDSVAWINTDGNGVFLTDTNETFRQNIVSSNDQDESFQDISLTSRIVSWVSRTETQVWDRVQNRLVTLSPEPSYQALSGDTLIWIPPSKQLLSDKAQDLQPNDQIIHVLDTNQLPR
jgi:hypothetical protein